MPICDPAGNRRSSTLQEPTGAFWRLRRDYWMVEWKIGLSGFRSAETGAAIGHSAHLGADRSQLLSCDASGSGHSPSPSCLFRPKPHSIPPSSRRTPLMYWSMRFLAMGRWSRATSFGRARSRRRCQPVVRGRGWRPCGRADM